MAISGLVITYNEEKNIASCISSLFAVCDEVVVIDSFSQDATVSIAKDMGAKVYIQSFLGDGPQRTFGLQFCKNDWILNLDADERLDSDAIKEIKLLDFQNLHYEAYEMKRKNHLHGQWIKVAGWYPDYICRLFNKTKTDFAQVKTHSRVLTKNLKKLNCNIIHYSFVDYEDMIRRMNTYSSWQSQALYEKKYKVNGWTPFLHFLVSFVKHYVIKRGFMAGVDGFSISLYIALNSYFKYAKLIEKYRLDTKGNL